MNTPVSDPGRSTIVRLRDVSEPTYSVLFKTPPADSVGEEYAIGMERVAYVLGDRLALPIPPVYLEEFDGVPGAMLETVENEVSWLRYEQAGYRGSVVNADVVALAAVFDVWIANVDRRKRNILLQPLRGTTEESRWKLWLIDHGYAALWPVGKFGLPREAPVDAVSLPDDGATLAERRIGEVMPSAYRRAFWTSPDETT